MKKTLVFLLLLFNVLLIKAQTGFTAKQFESYLVLKQNGLISELAKKGYRLVHTENLPKETQYQFVSKVDDNKRFLAIYFGDKLGIIENVGYLPEQNLFKSSLKNDGFIYKETNTRDGSTSIKYDKDGKLAGHGLELELGTVAYRGRTLYDVFFWNWRPDYKAISNLNETVKTSPVASKVVDIIDNDPDKLPNSVLWKSGTKKFYDDAGLWYLAVSIANNAVKIENYAGRNNSYQKDKLHPVSVDRGEIKNNTIYSYRDGVTYKNEFRYVHGAFYTANNEGAYNIYKETSTGNLQSKNTIGKSDYTAIDLAEKASLKKYLSDHLNEVAVLNGDYRSDGNISIGNGKITLCLIGQNFIDGVLKKSGDNHYSLYFFQPNEMRDLSTSDWKIYSKSTPIAKFSIVNKKGDLKMQWLGLYNRKTHQLEYDDLDANPQSKVQILKKEL